ncbi:MAG: hypothetical protein COA79_07970 [Planctomycetota bacterium]|nr:MAG: hypothetical protein COA79_07970 [Planctomycetota bacterium]
MAPDKKNLQRVENKINQMLDSIIQGNANFKTAKLVGFYIVKKGLRKNKDRLKEALPMLTKLLFDFGELQLCADIFTEAIYCFPKDKELKKRKGKIDNLLKFNVVKKSLPEDENKSGKEGDINDMELSNIISKYDLVKDDSSSFDLGAEITNIEEGTNHDKTPYEKARDLSLQQTMISTQMNVGANENEMTLIPTDSAGLDMTSSESTFSDAPSAVPIPEDMLTEYPGLREMSGRYEHIDMLGEGGMGGVFLAFDKQLERKVAIKFMNKSCVLNAEVTERFIREARAQAVASHPGIVSIYDVGTRGNPFIVMEYVDGKTIRDVIKKGGGFALSESCRVMKHIAEALEYAHKKKIIHRDVKPDNIILDEFDKPRLLDFGLAKLESTPSTTMVNQIMGTPYYMAPEQISGGTIGPATDVYAWGVMLYQLTTGTVPFTKGDILYHHVNSLPIPPIEMALDIPHSLNKVILKCMEKEHSERYKNFDEVLKDFESIKI